MAYIARLLTMTGSREAAATAPSRGEGRPTVPDLEVDEVREVVSPRPSPEPASVAAPEVGAARPLRDEAEALDRQTEGAPPAPPERQRFELPAEGILSADGPRLGDEASLEPVLEESVPTDGRPPDDAEAPPPRPESAKPPSPEAADRPDESEPRPVPPTVDGSPESTDSPPAELDEVGRFREALHTVRQWMVQPEPDVPQELDVTDSASRLAAESTWQPPERRRSLEPAVRDRDWSTPPVEQTVEISIGTIDVTVEKPTTAAPARPTAPAPGAGADGGTAPPFKPARHFIRS